VKAIYTEATLANARMIFETAIAHIKNESDIFWENIKKKRKIRDRKGYI